MPTIHQLPNGKWRAQAQRRGVRASASFEAKDDAERWAKNKDCELVGGTDGERISLTAREWADLCNRAKERARVRGIEFNLTREDIEDLFFKANGKCSVSGILFNRFRPAGSTKRPWYPSLDRIDSRKPYTHDNCRFVCVAVNIALGEWGEWTLMAIVNAIAFNEPVKNEGLEAEPYTFKPIGEPVTYRQRVRRRIRDKSREIHEQNTNE